MSKSNIPLHVVIVESPAKAKTIADYLNSSAKLRDYGKFKVVSSMGHIRDLKPKELGIDVINDFTPLYAITLAKKKLVAELKEWVVKAKATSGKVWLASDHDREGEAIAMHLRDALRLKEVDYHRIIFTEITKPALEHAVLHPRRIDTNLVDAQETRRILDRLVGFSLSPLLWKQFATTGTLGLSAGRVQSAVLNILVEKEEQIEARGVGEDTYYHLLGDFEIQTLKKKKKVSLSGTHLYGENHTVWKSSGKKEAVAILKQLSGDFCITHFKESLSKKRPDAPYITSTLQQDAYSKLGVGMKQVMKLAQDLYEKGYITYMRTDSYNLSDTFRDAAVKYIEQKWGSAFVPTTALKTKQRAKSKNAQEAHEAIRPTDVQKVMVATSDEPSFTSQHGKLYSLIWKRAVASLMSPCEMRDTVLHVVDTNKAALPPNSYFKGTLSTIHFSGYMIVWGAAEEEPFFGSKMALAEENSLSVMCKEITAKQTWTSPPARYNEATIVKMLEKEGIGRPSTYAGIMTKLYEKQYIAKKNIVGVERPVQHYVYTPHPRKRITIQENTTMVGEENARIVPTDIGVAVNKFLRQWFAYIVDKSFTANMEADLDRIAGANKSRLDVLKQFWTILEKDIDKVKATHKENKAARIPKTKLQAEQHVHTINGVEYILRIAKFGPVIQWSTSTSSSDKPNYKSLKQYLAITKKDMSDLTADDIIFVVSSPHRIGNINHPTSGETLPVSMDCGPFGYYAKVGSTNVSLTRKTVLKYVKDRTIDMADIVAAFEYKINGTTTSSSKKKKTDKTK